jgi:hypothetical protein
VADEDRIAKMFGMSEDEGLLTPEKAERVLQEPGVSLRFPDDDELAKVSPAAALTRDLLDSGEDAEKFFARRGIPVQDEQHPDRPTHPDFLKLAQIVTQFDDLADKGMDLMDVAILKGLDMASLVYMAKQRALRAKTAYNPVDFPNSNEETRMAASWLDGFMAGQDFGATKTKIEERIVLGPIEDAQHRARGDRNE